MYARKKYLLWVYDEDRKKTSFGITVRHHSASLEILISDLHDRFFYPHHTLVKNTEIQDDSMDTMNKNKTRKHHTLFLQN